MKIVVKFVLNDIKNNYNFIYVSLSIDKREEMM